MKVKIIVIGLILTLFVLGGLGYGAYRYFLSGSAKPAPVTEETVELLPPADSSIAVTVTTHPSEANTVVMKVSGLDAKYSALEYDFEYDSNGRILGVNSGTKPLDVTGQSEFSRDIYLGTCSKNVCKPDTNVTAVIVSMKLTDKEGKKSQFSGDFEI